MSNDLPSCPTPDEHREILSRANARGMTIDEYRAWNRKLRRDYRSLKSDGGIVATTLGHGSLFFLVEDDAELGVTMCNRAMTSEEWAEYCMSPACTRRRKPGDTVETYEARKQRRRTSSLIREVLAW